MTRCLVIALALLGSVGGPARAACTTPFGGDDTGCVPPDPDSFKYEAKVGKRSFGKTMLACT